MRRSSVVRRALPRAWQAHATAERTKTHTSLLAIAATAHLPGYVLLAAPKNVLLYLGNNIGSHRTAIAPQSRSHQQAHGETAAQRSRGDAVDGSCLRHYYMHHAADFDLQPKHGSAAGPRHRETAAQRSHGINLRHCHRHHTADFDLQLAPTSPPATCRRIVPLLRGDFSSRATSFATPGKDGVILQLG